jgi:hypothetical protein
LWQLQGATASELVHAASANPTTIVPDIAVEDLRLTAPGKLATRGIPNVKDDRGRPAHELQKHETMPR